MQDRLHRSRKRRVIGGVSSGLGEYLNLDPVIIRIIFLIITLINGLGILLYIILWIVIPESDFDQKDYSTVEANSATNEKEENSTLEEKSRGITEDKSDDIPINKNINKGSGRVIAGIILIGFGLIFLAKEYIPVFHFFDLLPIFLVVIGIVLIWNTMRRK